MPGLSNIHVYVVNLKHDIEKKEYTTQILKKLNISAEFIQAVNGRKLEKNYITQVNLH